LRGTPPSGIFRSSFPEAVRVAGGLFVMQVPEPPRTMNADLLDRLSATESRISELRGYL
jgi:hypothetical protein